jgi:uncharacterized RDD family membrane protein YckC
MTYPAPGHPGYSTPTVSYANWIQRVGAYLIDQFIAGIPAAIGYVIFMATMADGEISGAGLAIYLLLSLVSLGVAIYNRWILAGKTGQSWGRKLLNVRLVGEQTGQPVGAGMAFVRDLCHFADSIICYIGFLFPLWDAKRQTIADKIVKTVVVSG